MKAIYQYRTKLLSQDTAKFMTRVKTSKNSNFFPFHEKALKSDELSGCLPIQRALY